MQSLVSNKLIQLLKKQKYHLVGRHSAVKRCRWLYESLIHNRVCYKQRGWTNDKDKNVNMFYEEFAKRYINSIMQGASESFINF